MLWMLLESGATFLHDSFQRPLHQTQGKKAGATGGFVQVASGAHTLPELALPQLMLALVALVSLHVQIVNRIASAYPIWYVTISAYLFGKGSVPPEEKTWLQSPMLIRGLIMYALIQGMLFANFLPPA